MALFPAIIDDPKHSLVVFQSSIAQTSLPIIRNILTTQNSSRKSLLFSLQYPASFFLGGLEYENLEIHDLLDHVPGYDASPDIQGDILARISAAFQTPLPLNVVIDSVDILLLDIGSLSKTYLFLREVLALVEEHLGSRLILHVTHPSELTPLLVQTAFSSSLAHIIAHPAALLKHIATEYLTPPPPASPEVKFWGVFLPLSVRTHEAERLVFGNTGEGSGDSEEIVIEVLVRCSGKKRAVQRALEGWSINSGVSCELTALEGVRSLWVRQTVFETPAVDPTQNLSFNLNLTSSQQESRAQVPLPYAHEGRPQGVAQNKNGAIFYDPDSADDIDDDDPDEDLDI